MCVPLVCVPKSLPRELWQPAASMALRENPQNEMRPRFAPWLGRGEELAHWLARTTGRRWSSAGVRLSVGFLDGPPGELRARILRHMNAWGTRANVEFSESGRDAQVRIARSDSPRELSGYWSYMGTDILFVPSGQPTLNLQDFSMATPESEFYRVVRHQAGHTLGFPHRPLQRVLVDMIDEASAIEHFCSVHGWTADEVRYEILTSLEESWPPDRSFSDVPSIMGYQIPGTVTKDGDPIVGAPDVAEHDHDDAAAAYPKRLL